MPSTDFGSDRSNPGGWGGSGGAAAGGQGGMGGQKASQPTYGYSTMPGARPGTNAIGNWNTGGNLVGFGNQNAVTGPGGQLIGGSLHSKMKQLQLPGGKGANRQMPAARQGVPDPRRRGQPGQPAGPAQPAYAPPPANIAAIMKRLGIAEDAWRWPANKEVVPTGEWQGPTQPGIIDQRPPPPIYGPRADWWRANNIQNPPVGAGLNNSYPQGPINAHPGPRVGTGGAPGSSNLEGINAGALGGGGQGAGGGGRGYGW